jgi:signal transduction histidine kinase
MGHGIRHVLIDSYCREGAQGFTGMFVLMKDLGDFSMLEQQMQRTEKLATIGKIAAGIAHEIRNPLTTVRGLLQMLEHRYASQNVIEQREYVQVMLQEIDRVNDLVSELLLLAKPHRMCKVPSSIQQLVEELRPLVESEALLRKIEVRWHLLETPLVWADAGMMKQVVLNLVKNAMEAMEDGGVLTVSLDVDGGTVRLEVADTGPGIPYYQMDKIFDAFFTTKEKGTGLGLPICQRIISEHKGEIRVSSKGFGTTFSILLPKLLPEFAQEENTNCL